MPLEQLTPFNMTCPAGTFITFMEGLASIGVHTLSVACSDGSTFGPFGFNSTVVGLDAEPWNTTVPCPFGYSQAEGFNPPDGAPTSLRFYCKYPVGRNFPLFPVGSVPEHDRFWPYQVARCPDRLNNVLTGVSGYIYGTEPSTEVPNLVVRLVFDCGFGNPVPNGGPAFPPMMPTPEFPDAPPPPPPPPPPPKANNHTRHHRHSKNRKHQRSLL